MQFKVKNLMISLLPAASCDAGCSSPTCDAGSNETVGSCTSECARDPIGQLIYPPDFEDLRVMLMHALARIEKPLQKLPASKEETEQLEKQLEEALAEVRQHKKQLLE